MAQPDVKIRLTADDQTRAAFASANGNLKKLQAGAASLRSAFGALGVAASVGGLAAFAKSGIDSADALNDLSQRVGVSVKDLASFKLAAQLADTSLEGVGRGIARLSRSIGDAEGGNKKLAEALKSLGITARDPKEAFLQLADATQRIADPATRAALLNQVLGKSYQELVPLLEQGGDALRQSAAASETFAESMAKLAPDAAKFNDQLDEMKQNAAGLASAVLVEVVPALNEFLSRIKLVKELLGKGGLFNFIANTAGTDDLNEVMQRLNKNIAITQKIVDGGNESFREKLNGLIAMRDSLINSRVADAMAPPQTETMRMLKDARATAGGVDLSAASGGTTKNLDLAKFAAEDLARAMKMAADEQERFADDAAFMREVTESQSNAVNAIAQEWVEAGRALKAEMITPLESFEARLEYINELWRRGVIDIETYARATEGAFDENIPALEKTKSLAEEIGLSFTSAFEDAVAGGKSFSDVLKALEQDLIKLLVRKTVTEPLFKAIEGIDLGAIFGGATANASGNVYSSPGLSAYSGSVVSKPTLFPFANGIGLMGEAGAEAILPLKRGSDGKLGVSGGGGSVQVNVINNASGTQASATERNDNGVRIIDVMVEQVEGAISRRAGRGEGIAPMLERRYGLNPSAGAMR